jgi:hypothetical protein
MRSRAIDTPQYVMLIMYSIILILIPLLMYIPRIKEIISKSGGSVRKAAFHHSIKERP